MRKLLALLGLLLILASTLLGLASSQWWSAMRASPPGADEMALWMRVQSVAGIAPEQGFVWSIIGSVFGLLLIAPWWRRRRRHENEWWEKRDEPLRTWPPAGM